jgi:hypothetical protein
VWIIKPPFIPRFYPSLQNFQVSFVSHNILLYVEKSHFIRLTACVSSPRAFFPKGSRSTL